jgi:hypothetical protein
LFKQPIHPHIHFYKQHTNTTSTTIDPNWPGWPLQKHRITKHRGWKRRNGRLKSRRRPPPRFKKFRPTDYPGRETEHIAIPDDVTPLPSPIVTKPEIASPSKFFSAFGGIYYEKWAFDKKKIAFLHPRMPPPRYRHQIVMYFLNGTDPLVRPRRL